MLFQRQQWLAPHVEIKKIHLTTSRSK